MIEDVAPRVAEDLELPVRVRHRAVEGRWHLRGRLSDHARGQAEHRRQAAPPGPQRGEELGRVEIVLARLGEPLVGGLPEHETRRPRRQREEKRSGLAVQEHLDLEVCVVREQRRRIVRPGRRRAREARPGHGPEAEPRSVPLERSERSRPGREFELELDGARHPAREFPC
ncbi:MAG: hypothetical protein ACK55I_07835, partial [bacterium]